MLPEARAPGVRHDSVPLVGDQRGGGCGDGAVTARGEMGAAKAPCVASTSCLALLQPRWLTRGLVKTGLQASGEPKASDRHSF